MLKLKEFTISDKTKKTVKHIAIGAGALAIVGGAVALGRATMEKEVYNQIFRLLSQTTDGGLLLQLKDGRELFVHSLRKG